MLTYQSQQISLQWKAKYPRLLEPYQRFMLSQNILKTLKSNHSPRLRLYLRVLLSLIIHLRDYHLLWSHAQAPARIHLSVDHRVSEQKVIQSELSQLKDNSKVYYKQPNSNVFFLSSVEKEMNRSKKTIDDLMKDYQQIQEDSSK
ncbi:hypothetical protein RRG08_026855 [Elysia crispata]|uniref:Uncharacterized protein n=1 Tax=Elysia crispata TaxID=231223 RepID=A0AAE0Y6K8_9GAST|nr:hypothetical protein RRG08_026855 [Elysia crispata]